MISIECDNCERLFDVQPKDAGARVACPYCGDINRVPAEQSSDPSDTQRKLAFRRAIPQKVESAPASATKRPTAAETGGEQVLANIRPAMFRAHPFRYSVLVILFLAGLVGSLSALVSGSSGQGWLAILGVIVALAAALWWLVWWIKSHWWVRIEVTNRRTVRYSGIITRHSTEVLHDHVRSVDIKQTFMQRIFNIGTVGIDSAGQDGIEIQVSDIPSPYRVKELVDRYRRM